MSAFEGASMPYSDQVKENSESMGKEGEKMVKESDFGRLGQKIDWGHFVSQKLHRNRLSVLPPHPLILLANICILANKAHFLLRIKLIFC